MDKVIKELSIRFKKDKRVIETIVHHPLLFTKHKIEDPNDIRPIMILYFGKFVLKTGKTVEDKIANTERYNKRRNGK